MLLGLYLWRQCIHLQVHEVPADSISDAGTEGSMQAENNVGLRT